MTVYLVLIFAVAFPALLVDVNKDDHRKKYYLLYSFFLITLLASLRSFTVGTDMTQYCAAYKYFGTSTWVECFYLRYEIGFVIMCKILNYISADYQLLIVATSCYIFVSVAVFIYRNSEELATSVIIFLCMFFSLYLSALRQCIAVCILLNGLQLIKMNKKFKFIFVLLLATSFHYSAIICFVFIIVYRLKIPKALFPVIGLNMAVFVIFFREIISVIFLISIFSDYKNYIGSWFDTGRDSAIIKVFTVLLILFFYVFTVKKNRHDLKMSREFTINSLLIWLAIQILVISAGFVGRLSFYFRPIILISIPLSVINIRNKNFKKPLKILIWITLACYFILYDAGKNETNIIPYRFFTANNELEYLIDRYPLYR